MMNLSLNLIPQVEDLNHFFIFLFIYFVALFLSKPSSLEHRYGVAAVSGFLLPSYRIKLFGNSRQSDLYQYVVNSRSLYMTSFE